MAATLALCPSRNMLSSVCLLPIPLAFHCSMFFLRGRFIDINKLLYRIVEKKDKRKCNEIIQKTKEKIHGSREMLLSVI